MAERTSDYQGIGLDCLGHLEDLGAERLHYIPPRQPECGPAALGLKREVRDLCTEGRQYLIHRDGIFRVIELREPGRSGKYTSVVRSELKTCERLFDLFRQHIDPYLFKDNLQKRL